MSSDAPWIDRVPLFAGIDPASRKRILAEAEELRFDEGAHLIEEGSASDTFWVLLEGTAGVFYAAPEGGGLLVKVFSGPSAFGEMEIFFDLPRMESVTAFTDVEVVRMPAKKLLELLQRDSTLCFHLMRDVAARLCIAADNERNLAFENVEARLAALFLSFLEASRVGEFARRELPFKLTYHTLARCLGVTERSIERTVGKWLQEGWVTRSRGRYCFDEADELEKRAPRQRLTVYSRLGLLPDKR